MKKLFIIAMLVLIVAGCQSVSPPQTYRPANYSGKAWEIAGELNEVNLHLTITINNEKVIDDVGLSLMGAGEFQGTYLKSAVRASCNTRVNPLMGNRTYCYVFVDGDRAAAFTF